MAVLRRHLAAILAIAITLGASGGRSQQIDSPEPWEHRIDAPVPWPMSGCPPNCARRGLSVQGDVAPSLRLPPQRVPRAPAGSPQRFLEDARRALDADRLGDATDALEQAETRLLGGSAMTQRGGGVGHLAPHMDVSLNAVADALKALREGNVALARDWTAEAMATDSVGH